MRYLTALPVYNEAAHLEAVLAQVREYSPDVLVVNDGSTDGTAEKLAALEGPGLKVLTHPVNRGYGAALFTAFDYALREGYDLIVTIDCDGQHEPQRIPLFVEAAKRSEADVISGSRYLKVFEGDTPPPEERRRINSLITAEINRRLGWNLTDAFCGFKAYRVPLLAKLDVRETGYAMPLELWVQLASVGSVVEELPVPLIYLDEKRTFGGALDDATTRLELYHLVLDRSMAEMAARCRPVDLAAGWADLPCGEPCS